MEATLQAPPQPQQMPGPGMVLPPAGDKPSSEKAPLEPSREAIVKKWTGKINGAKDKFKDDFDRMRTDMEFCGGIQWPQQDKVDDQRYRANMVVREINQSVASMFARNPKAVAQRKQRLDYEFWDGTVEQLQMAAMSLMQQPTPMAMMILEDHRNYLVEKALLDRIAQSLEKEYQVQWDRQEIDLKLQHKQLVRRVKVTGVGYVRLSFKREDRKSLPTTGVNDTVIDRAERIYQLVDDKNKGKWDKDDSKMELLKSLMSSVQYSMSNPQDMQQVNEALVWDFPPSTSVIVDPACKMLKGFVGANWLAIEYPLDLDDAKAIFNKPDLTIGQDGAKTYDDKGKEIPGSPSAKEEKSTKVMVWEVLDKKNRQRFFLCDGYKDYLLEPEELRPCVQGFWPIRALTFNDNETEPGLKTSIYPESDVRLMMSAQVSINSAREALRKHRRFNRPKYYAPAGVLKDEDKDRLKNPPDGALIELQGIPPGSDPNKVLAAAQVFPIDIPVYDTGVNERDIQKSTTTSQPPLELLQPRTTATSAQLAAQQNVQTASSDVDDLDEMLSWEARTGGEMMFREMSKPTVQKDVGRGAPWPESQQMRDQFCDRIFLDVQAASSGRPNKGLEISNFREIAPLLIQTGANPQFIIREAVKRLDDRLDPTDAFPLPGMLPAPSNGSGSAGKAPSPNQPPNQTAGPPAPLPISHDATSINPS